MSVHKKLKKINVCLEIGSVMGKGSQKEITRDTTKEIPELERRGDRSFSPACFSQPTAQVGPASLVAVKNFDNPALTL